VPRPQRPNRIGRDRRRRRHVRQQAAVRPPELERPVEQSLDLVALLVHRPMMAATQYRQVRQGRRAALRPVAHVMPLADSDVAAREAAAPVPMLQRPPQRGRNRPRPGPDLHHPPVLVVPHHDPACVARQPPGRFRGNVAPLFQHGLAGLLRIREDRGVYVDHHLIPLTRGPRVELVMQRRLGQQGQRVGLLLWPGRNLLGRVGGRQDGLVGAAPLVQRLAGRVERP
jgi:hypothetical protein